MFEDKVVSTTARGPANRLGACTYANDAEDDVVEQLERVPQVAWVIVDNKLDDAVRAKRVDHLRSGTIKVRCIQRVQSRAASAHQEIGHLTYADGQGRKAGADQGPQHRAHRKVGRRFLSTRPGKSGKVLKKSVRWIMKGWIT